ncbi:MAG TPA: TGS domain-containing protein, partial [Clostridia bacterium]|nr:TGS domain-containing protein [Clostridia bacterium]
MIDVTLKDGSKIQVEKGTSVIEVAKMISHGLARNAVLAEVDGVVTELGTTLDKDCTLNILTFDSEEGKKAYRHTTSHILAQAVMRLYKDVRLAIGPATENGFYYDFDIDGTFTSEDLAKIEEEM